MKQPWLRSWKYDGLWILSPPILATLGIAVLFAFRPELAEAEMSPWAWLFLVLAIDVSHVYASLYRTVLNSAMRERWGLLFAIVPPLAYLLGYALYQKDSLWFWRVLAYLAVFHFVRQPYGLMMLYKRAGPREPTLAHRIDQIAIYTASLYPIWCWHFDPSRTFHWFLQGDFFGANSPLFVTMGHAFAMAVLLIYVTKESVLIGSQKSFNIPKNLVLAGTAISFGFGILYWNSDLAFTATNVIGHGIAYLGLVWWSDGRAWYSSRFPARWAALFPVMFAVGLLGFAYLEEGLWDLLVWGEHRGLFTVLQTGLGAFGVHTEAIESKAVLAFVVPLLALPQAVHYVLDGVIWRRKI